MAPLPLQERPLISTVPLLPVLVLDKMQKYLVRLPHHLNLPPLCFPLALQFLGLPGTSPGYQALDGLDDVPNDDI